MTSKGIYRRADLSTNIVDRFMLFQEPLRAEFIKSFESIEAATETQCTTTLDPTFRGDVSYDDGFDGLSRKLPATDTFVSDVTAWQMVGFKYENPSTDTFFNAIDDRLRQLYPSACRLIEELGNDCPIAMYSIMKPQTVLHRHTGPENRTGEFIRFHIPLIIPSGDVFLEANGEEVDWSDIFAFNNQLPHSAHNLTNEFRVVFLFDVRRTSIGLAPGEPYDPNLEQNVIPFVRKTI